MVASTTKFLQLLLREFSRRSRRTNHKLLLPTSVSCGYWDRSHGRVISYISTIFFWFLITLIYNRFSFWKGMFFRSSSESTAIGADSCAGIELTKVQWGSKQFYSLKYSMLRLSLKVATLQPENVGSRSSSWHKLLYLHQNKGNHGNSQ